jgi:uncharacterized phage protein (TIGR02218 family)
MRTLSDALKAHYSADITTLATCWKILRKDGQVLGFTSHNRDLIIDTIRYEATSGFTPTAIDSSSDVNPDTLSVQAVLDSERISTHDVLAGRYDAATIEIFEVNYENLSQGKLILQTGWLGEVRMDGAQCHADIFGLTDRLSASLGAVYSRTCRAALGDAQCGINLNARRVSGAITEIITPLRYKDSTRTEVQGIYSHGLLNWTSGANMGLSSEIAVYSIGEFRLNTAPPYPVMVADTYTVTQGCDKQFSTCTARFNNAINFRGEPHLAGLDKMWETGSTRRKT